MCGRISGSLSIWLFKIGSRWEVNGSALKTRSSSRRCGTGTGESYCGMPQTVFTHDPWVSCTHSDTCQLRLTASPPPGADWELRHVCGKPHSIGLIHYFIYWKLCMQFTAPRTLYHLFPYNEDWLNAFPVYTVTSTDSGFVISRTKGIN